MGDKLINFEEDLVQERGLFLKPNRLLGDIGVAVETIIGSPDEGSEKTLTENKIIISLIVNIGREVDEYILQLNLDNIFNRSRQFIGIGGIYEIYNPKLTISNLNITVELDHKLIKSIPIKKMKESVALIIIKEKYPQLYDILEDPNFTSPKFLFRDLLYEINYIEDFEFPMIKIRGDIGYAPDDIKNLLIRAHLYHVYPYLYSKIRDLNAKWMVLLLGLSLNMRHLLRQFRAQALQMTDFLETGFVSRDVIEFIINMTRSPELFHALLETNDPQITIEERNFMSRILVGSDLFKKGYLP